MKSEEARRNHSATAHDAQKDAVSGALVGFLTDGGIDVFNPWTVTYGFPVYVKGGRLAHERIATSMGLRLNLDGKDIAAQVQRKRFRSPVDYLVIDPAFPAATWTHIGVTASQPGPNCGPVSADDDLRTVVLTSGDLVLRIHAATAAPQSLVYRGEELLAGPADIDFNAMFRIEGRTVQSGPIFSEARFRILAFEPAYKLAAGNGRLRQPTRMRVTHRVYRSGKYEFWVDAEGWEGESPWVGMDMNFALPIAGRSIPCDVSAFASPDHGIDFRDFGQSVQNTLQFFQNRKTVVARREEGVRNGRRYRATLFLLPPDAHAMLDMWTRLIDEGPIVDIEPVRAVVSRRASVQSSSDNPLIRDAVCDLTARWSSDQEGSSNLIVDLAVEPPLVGEAHESWELWLENARYHVRGSTPHAVAQAVEFMRQHSTLSEDNLALPLAADTCVAAIRGVSIGGEVTEVDFCRGSEAAWETALGFLAKAGVNRLAVMPMWGTWKLPIRYDSMPELRSVTEGDFDWISYLPFKDIDAEGERGHRLVKSARRLGFELHTEVVVGRVPDTFSNAYPDAVVPTSPDIPCTTHPEYIRFLRRYLSELIKTYGLDGVFLVRDDFCELCSCDRCSEQTRRSPYHSLFWDLCVDLHAWAKTDLPGALVAVYPYNDSYRSEMDLRLPRDLLILGHGSGESVLARADNACAPHGDTWLDNVFIGFRTPAAPAMKRLLTDRNAMWCGGWLDGSQLTWASIGAFGWDPEMSVQSLRFMVCRDLLPDRDSQIQAVRALGLYEQLREWFNHALLPKRWLAATTIERDDWAQRVTTCAERLEHVLARMGPTPGWTWRPTLDLFALFIRYYLERLDLFVQEFAVWRPAHDDLRQAIAVGHDCEVGSSAQLLARLAERHNELVRGFAVILRTHGGEAYESIVHEHFEPGSRAQLDRMGFESDITNQYPAYPFDAHVVGHTISARMQTNETHTVTVTVRNLGSRPWEFGWDSLVLLGVGVNSVEAALPSPRVLFGETCAFRLSVKAPSVSGMYQVQVGMHALRRVPIYGQILHTMTVT